MYVCMYLDLTLDNKLTKMESTAKHMYTIIYTYIYSHEMLRRRQRTIFSCHFTLVVHIL
jgi:hypothetical protein